MKSKDITQKMLEGYNDVFADIVNVLLFNGKRVIKENTLFEAGIESTLKFDGNISSQDRDVAKYWNKSKINLAMLGFENQTVQDRLMPMRVFSYDGAEYGKQSRRSNSNEKKYPVITLVLYFGYNSRWTSPRNLTDLLELNDDIKPFVNDYKINVFELAYLDKDVRDLFNSDFRFLVDYLYQMRINKSYNPDKSVIVNHVYEFFDLMRAMTGDIRYKKLSNEFKGRRNVAMCEALDKIEEIGVKKGILIGREEGREEGRILGVEQGEDLVSRLNGILAREGNIEKILKASEDRDYRKVLLREYKLI